MIPSKHTVHKCKFLRFPYLMHDTNKNWTINLSKTESLQRSAFCVILHKCNDTMKNLFLVSLLYQVHDVKIVFINPNSLLFSLRGAFHQESVHKTKVCKITNLLFSYDKAAGHSPSWFILFFHG